jgi:NTE family protein
MKETQKKVGLVLGGGGARGLAHLGVLRSMEERGFRAESIAGCSMGGIIGALVANGMSSRDMISAFEDLNELDLLDFGAMGGIIGGKGIAKTMGKYLPATFEQLGLPLKVTAVDLQAGELVVFGSGSLIPALLATCALPGILSPVPHMGRFFLDGGLLNNLPVDIIRTMTHSPVIAVDVAAPPNRNLDFGKKEGVVDRLKKISKRNFRTLTLELFMKSFDIPAALVTKMRLSMSPPDVLIRPDLETNFGVEDFHRLEEAVKEGYRVAEEALDGARL